MAEGQRNQHTYVLAAAFNDFGISKSLASYVLGRVSKQIIYSKRDTENY